MEILVSGLVNIETNVRVRKFPVEYYPIDYPFFGVSSEVSGVGFNLAAALRTLGDTVSLVSFVGGDWQGEVVLDALRGARIDCAGIRRTLKSTPASVVLVDEAGRRQIYCDLKDVQEQSLAEDTLRGAPCLLALCNTNFNRALLKAARRSGRTIATDVHVLTRIDDAYNREFMENADILFLSDEGLPCPDAAFARALRAAYGSRIIVIGCGARGALLCDETGRVFRFDAVPCARVVNTVGAGDALFSGFLHFYAKGLSAHEALVRAEAFAAIKIGFNGASVGFAEEAEVERVAQLYRPAVREV